MQFPESWLRSLCNPPLTTEVLCHTLTMAGLEVEECRPVGADFSNVVVARILTAEKHPDADKLKLCTVDAGEHGVLQIVCGAPNAAAGLRVPCALVGAKLPGIEIKKARVRGIESHGMLCSARELGLSEDQGGLLVLPDEAPIGHDVREILALDDKLITLKLTPNRADCLSLVGIARELAALTGAPLTLPESKSVSAVHEETRTVVLDAPSHCPRYCGRIVRDVNAKAPTPEWMKRRLDRCGVRPISVLVDVTNYVMLEIGQPLHAFDDDALVGAIHVRLPQVGEKLLLLNGKSVEPAADSALIADEEKPLALAGIMGGEHSGIGDATTNLFLESAFFTPGAIAGKARALGFSSDASYRYERGVDFDLQRRAIERATQLIVDICGGRPGPVVEVIAPAHLPQRMPIHLRSQRVKSVLGIDVTATRMKTLLESLGLQVQAESGGAGFLVSPPSFRFDIGAEEDLIEEIARLHGYDNIPAVAPMARTAMLPASESWRTPMQLRRLIAERDYHEVVTYSFVDAAWERDFSAINRLIMLANPIASQMGVMRSTLIGGLVDTLITNRKRQIERVRIFELGRCFLREVAGTPVPGFLQPLRLAGLAAGLAAPEQWGLSSRKVDFYDVKADVEALLAPQHVEFQRISHPALHPGRCAGVRLDGRQVGVIGELHPGWVQKYELGSAPVIFELEASALLTTPFSTYKEVSRFPAVVRDLALVVAQEQAVEPVLSGLRAIAPAIVQEIVLFDVYHGKNLGEEKKSLAFHIVMQDTERTLEEAEVDSALARLLAVAQEKFGASLR